MTTPDAQTDDFLAIGDDVDLITSIPRNILLAALEIAREQIDEPAAKGDSETVEAYGIRFDEADEFVSTLSRVLLDLGNGAPE